MNEIDLGVMKSGMGWLKKQPTETKLPEFVFVYGTLKRGMGNHGFLRDADYSGKARTLHEYPMIGDRGIPFVFPFKGIGHRIHGEVYLVSDPQTMLYLDYLERHPDNYRRAMVPVVQEGYTDPFNAWVYFFQHVWLMSEQEEFKSSFP